jgi:hypothetical protein
MTIFIHETYMVKPEKQEQFNKLLNRFHEIRKQKPEMFKELKSFKHLTQGFGSFVGSYVELLEYDSLTAEERMHTRLLEDEEIMKTLRPFLVLEEFMQFVDPATFSRNVWYSIE